MRSTLAWLAAGSLTLLASACTSQQQGANTDPSQVDSTALPEQSACRMLTPADVHEIVNATVTVPCSHKHTAQTYAVGELPDSLHDTGYDSEEQNKWAYQTCSSKFQRFVGADESLVLRTTISWAWFRPSQKAWDEGARWYRCDVYGGNDASTSLRPLPEDAHNMLAGRPDDHWLACALGPTLEKAAKVPCSQKHNWRAVTTIKLGEAADAYPGDAVAESRSHAFCASSVKAWLNYPATFQFGYTSFHEAEWSVGNRRSVCWAMTDD